jgi:hypothetical protein
VGVLTARAIGALVAIVASSACYSPDLRDCTVTCSTADDCAGDQVCGRDRLCAMPAVADHCEALSVADAGVIAPADAHGDAGEPTQPPHDAGTDAPPTPPPTQITLRVQIAGKGTVLVDGHGMCTAQGTQHGDCTFTVTRNVGEVLHAIADPTQKFAAWTSTTCKGQSTTCSFTPTAAVTVTVEFDKLGGGGP